MEVAGALSFDTLLLQLRTAHKHEVQLLQAEVSRYQQQHEQEFRETGTTASMASAQNDIPLQIDDLKEAVQISSSSICNDVTDAPPRRQGSPKHKARPRVSRRSGVRRSSLPPNIETIKPPPPSYAWQDKPPNIQLLQPPPPSYNAESSEGIRNFAIKRGASGAMNSKPRVKPAITIDDLNVEDTFGQLAFVSKVEQFLERRLRLGAGIEIRIRKFVTWWLSLKEPMRHGCIARVEASSWFNNLCMFVIALNGLFIVITTDMDMANARQTMGTQSMDVTIDPQVFAVDVSFTVFYMIELMLRMVVHRCFFFVCDAWKWNAFDLFLVVFSCVDMAVQVMFSGDGSVNLTFLRALRVLKVAKALRILRAVKFFTDLRLMLDCILGTFMALFWCLVLITFMLYMFSLVFVQQLAGFVGEHSGTGPDDMKTEIDEIYVYFGQVSTSMLTLFESTTGGNNWGNVYSVVKLGGQLLGILYVFFIAFFAIVAWNIVTSTFVEKAFKLSMPDIDSLVLEKRQKDASNANELTQLLSTRFEKSPDENINFDEFKNMLSDKRCRDLFAVRAIEMKDAEAFFTMISSICAYEESMTIRMFIGACLRLQGVATSLDLQTLHFDVKNSLLNQAELLEDVEELLCELRTFSGFSEWCDAKEALSGARSAT